MHQDSHEFKRRSASVVVIASEPSERFTLLWQKEGYDFVGLPDPEHTVQSLYGQEVKLLRLGRLPALIVIDSSGLIRHTHYGRSMSDIPDNRDILNILDSL